MRIAGLMSGTSLDGIDVAIVDVDDGLAAPGLTCAAFATVPYAGEMRSALSGALPPNAGSVRDVCVLNAMLGEVFAAALVDVAQRFDIALSSIELIGSHGHTLYHLPREDGRAPFAASTLQIGEAAIVAERTGITCVSDFRPADIAAGGQGAPLVSFVDFMLLRSEREHRVALNLGGIANVTILPRDGHAADATAYDVGPGTMLIDACAGLATDGALSCDDDGRLAQQGRVRAELLTALLGHPYYRLPPPKTAGREQFGLHEAREIWERARALGCAPADVVATVTELTARTVAEAIPHETDRVIVSGGGVRNPALMAMLNQELLERSALADRPHRCAPCVSTSDDFGMPADAKEAIAFALLARETVAGRPNTLPGSTGARHAAILGKITPAGGSRVRREVARA